MSDPAEFDIDEWLNGTTRLTKSVEVYGKPSLADEIASLEAQLADPKVHATRMGQKSPAVAIAKEIEDKRAEMEASKRTFTFQALSTAQETGPQDDMGGRDDNDELGLRIIAAMCVEPKGLTWQHFSRLRDGIGVSYFDATIANAVGEVRRGRDVSVPFSLNALHILETQQ